jgi:hypothetical protein
MKFQIIKFFKDFLLYTGILRIFSPFNALFLFLANFNGLRNWISKNGNGLLLNDFYSSKRNYEKRYKLYEAVAAHYELDEKDIAYLEFGVARATSFKWWIEKNKNINSRFFGFDTFEGLPEDWGGYKKGDMAHNIPDIADARANFIRGIFQDTLPGFLTDEGSSIKGMQKLIHLDADLFSSTIFVLSQLYPYINKGDLIIFDEFNVANHEFFAFKIFTEAFYVKLRPVAAQNNFYQTAFVVE